MSQRTEKPLLSLSLSLSLSHTHTHTQIGSSISPLTLTSLYLQSCWCRLYPADLLLLYIVQSYLTSRSAPWLVVLAWCLCISSPRLLPLVLVLIHQLFAQPKASRRNVGPADRAGAGACVLRALQLLQHNSRGKPHLISLFAPSFSPSFNFPVLR